LSLNLFSRRKILALGAAGGVAVAATAAHAATFGNPDEPPQGAVNAKPGALSDPGPQNPALNSQFPSSENPPATDVGSMPQFWSSFNIVHKRIQDGGWARQVTQADFAIVVAGIEAAERIGLEHAGVAFPVPDWAAIAAQR
jgi:oxalate decarboxylase